MSPSRLVACASRWARRLAGGGRIRLTGGEAIGIRASAAAISPSAVTSPRSSSASVTFDPQAARNGTGADWRTS